VNVVERLLERFDALPDPEELRGLAHREPRLLMPTSQMRAFRELEPPSADEGLAAVERVPFVRKPSRERPNVGVVVAAGALRRSGWQPVLARAHPHAPHLVFDWSPGANLDLISAVMERLSTEVSGPVEVGVCPHPAGPPRCWCRPPLPGLPLAFARARGVDLSRSILVGAGPAHRTLASTFGSTYVEV